jgi:aminoglycoside phosphotransferase
MSYPETPQTGVGGVRDDLRAVLEELLTTYFGHPRRILTLRRHPSRYATSFALEDVNVVFDDGRQLQMVFKDLSEEGLHEAARVAKPRFLYEPLREIATYRDILSREALGTAECYGAITDADRAWLFLEKVQGRELYQIGELAVWSDVACWLAGMHDRLSQRAEQLQRDHPHLLRYDAAFHRRWFDRAREFIGRAGADRERRDMARLVAGGETVIERLAAIPVTLVHGEFYASNVLVGDSTSGRRVCPVDWEIAGVGAGLLDLAALVAGWAPAQQRTIAQSYYTALAPRQGWPPDEDAFVTLLDYCQLARNMQWLGWSPQWTAPPEHARDWLGEAVQLAERLGL